MFIELTTTKNERFLVNLDSVELLTDTNKGIFVVLSDGSSFYCIGDFDFVCSQMKRCREFGIERGLFDCRKKVENV